MGYPKEIILYKNHNTNDFTAIELIDFLKKTFWETTLFLLDKGNEFDWVQLEPNKNGEKEFEKILKYKTELKEYIGFTLINRELNRYVTVNIDQERVLFDLDIRRDEDELKWFDWFYENLILSINGLQKRFIKIEWRTNYDNDIIRTFENNNKRI